MPPEGRIRELAASSGFDLVRFSPATKLHEERARYLEWIASGRQADMAWITAEHVARAADPRGVLPAARSVISLASSYWHGPRRPAPRGSGRVARYAWGRDYHDALGERLRSLSDRLTDEFGGEHRWYVDTGPLMDRALAARSGLGWYGKNTNIITEQLGSYVFLAEVITSLELQPDQPLDRSCGSCRLCMVACPTGALGPEYSLDSRKCIAYLTIEHRGPIPRELRSLMGDWVFGCDICQDVCPPAMAPHLVDTRARRAWSDQLRSLVKAAPAGRARAPIGTGGATDGGSNRQTFDLHWLLELSHGEYLEVFRGTAVRRAKVWMLRRNAAVALGNTGDDGDLPALARALQDEHPVVRGHAAWAIGQIERRTPSSSGQRILVEALAEEADDDVRGEISLALSACG